ncbi:DUF3793 family protein [Clostridium felsineum]|uniref:Uncharacterized protein n=1 Tax=Clostridium felsineum TaxID=36839 RepID=A0A1S8MG52_9CLOT|nr:DUF3793 family protein [Clostridium felsineum]URZ05317.1 hypothetical protein CLROS_006410 [Clostridium felsineum]URZ10358.1 hypothetical protein CROST_010660 [Clostridium felsineum]
MVELSYSFIDFIKGVTGKKYMVNLITYSIAPVMFKQKPSSIITISNEYKGMYDLWKTYGEEYLKYIDLDTFEIKREKDSLILLFYDKELLNKTLYHKTNMKFLTRFGYNYKMNLDEILEFLKERYKQTLCPHELGIFLGIPVEDVEEFIKCNGENCLYCGYWKVYKNKERALDTFKKYDESRIKAIKLLSENIELSQVKNIFTQ